MTATGGLFKVEPPVPDWLRFSDAVWHPEPLRSNRHLEPSRRVLKFGVRIDGYSVTDPGQEYFLQAVKGLALARCVGWRLQKASLGTIAEDVRGLVGAAAYAARRRASSFAWYDQRNAQRYVATLEKPSQRRIAVRSLRYLSRLTTVMRWTPAEPLFEGASLSKVSGYTEEYKYQRRRRPLLWSTTVTAVASACAWQLAVVHHLSELSAVGRSRWVEPALARKLMSSWRMEARQWSVEGSLPNEGEVLSKKFRTDTIVSLAVGAAGLNLMALTGARPDELVSVRPQTDALVALLQAGKAARLSKAMHKPARSQPFIEHIVPLVPDAAASVLLLDLSMRLCRTDNSPDCLFLDKSGRALKVSAFEKAVRTFVQRLGPRDIETGRAITINHTLLRKTLAAGLRSEDVGASEYVVSLILGHRDPRMTELFYGDHLPEEVGFKPIVSAARRDGTESTAA